MSLEMQIMCADVCMCPLGNCSFYLFANGNLYSNCSVFTQTSVDQKHVYPFVRIGWLCVKCT